MEEDGSGTPFERFEAAVEAALAEAGLNGLVSVWLQESKRAKPTVEIMEISATPMRQGNGTRCLGTILRVADEMGMWLTLRVASDADDFRTWEDGDPARPPSEDELVSWYGRSGFEVLSTFDEIVMGRVPATVPAPGPSP